MIKSLDLNYLKHFYHYASRYKKTTTIGLLMMPISVAANVLFPWLVIQVIDEHLTPGKYAGLMFLIAAMVVVLIVNYIADGIYTYCLRMTGQKA
ncbi:MAG: ATP-binding cassette subfamily B protein, partial [Psychromonas sp.]